MMELSIEKSADEKILVLKSDVGFFTKDFRFILLFFLLVFLEVPIFLLLIKFLGDESLFYIFAFIFVASIMGIFLLIIIFAYPKLFLLYANKEDGKLRLGWIKNLIFKSFQEIPFKDITDIYSIVVGLEKKKKVAINLKTIDGKTLNFSFILKDIVDDIEIARILITLSNILGFNTYKATLSSSILRIYFSKDFDLIAKTSDVKSIKFVKEDGKKIINNEFSIPDLKIKLIGERVISVLRKPNKYDLLRIIAFFVICPLIILIALLSKDPYKYHAIAFSISIYLIIIYIFRKYLVPIEVIFDMSTGEISIKRVLFSKKKFYLFDINEIEVKDVKINRMGTILFEISYLLKDNKKMQLFFVETPINSSKNFEVLVNIITLLEYLTSNFNIPIKNSCTTISNL